MSQDEDEEMRTTRWGLALLALVLVAAIGGGTVSCVNSSDNKNDFRDRCVAAGGSWLETGDTADGHCIRLS